MPARRDPGEAEPAAAVCKRLSYAVAEHDSGAFDALAGAHVHYRAPDERLTGLSREERVGYRNGSESREQDAREDRHDAMALASV
jgi:hypothetical protein